MWDMLYAFGIGISFSVGMLTGTTICAYITRKGIKDHNESWNKRQDGIEERLGSTLEQTTRIANYIGILVDKETKP